MKRRILAIFMIAAMILTMVPIVALAEDLPSITPVTENMEVFEGNGWTRYGGYSDEELQCWIDDYSKPYTHYSTEPRFIVDTDQGQQEVGTREPFVYQGVTYRLAADLYSGEELFYQTYENQIVVGQTYIGKVNLFDNNTNDILKENCATYTFKIVENPIESVALEYYSKRTFVGADQVSNFYWDDEIQDVVERIEYGIPAIKATITFKDDYKNEFGDTAVIDQMNNVYYIIIRGEKQYLNWDWGADRQSPTNVWGVGDHVATVSFMGVTADEPFTYTICDTPIKNITIKDMDIVEGCYDAYGEDENTGNGHYFVNPFRFGSNTQLATVEIKDEYKDDFEYDVVSNQLSCGDSRYYFSVDDPQSDENPWGVGTHKVNVSLLGFDTTFNVNIVKSPLKSFKVKDTNLLQYSDGGYVFEPDGTAWYKYNPAYIDFQVESIESINDKVSIITREVDGKTPGVDYDGQYYGIKSSFDQSVDNQLKLGEQSVPVSLLGVDGTAKLNVTKPTAIDRISSVELDEYLELEEKDLGISWISYANSDYVEMYCDSLYPSFVVNYKDGSVGYCDNQSQYYDAVDGVYYSVGINFDGRELLDPFTQKLDWEVGSIHDASMYFLGKEYQFKIKVVPNKISSLEVLDSITVPSDAIQYDFSDKVGDLRVKIVYRDGTEEIKKYSDTDLYCTPDYMGTGKPYIMSDYSEDAASAEIPVIKVSSEISSLVIDETTVGKAYWAKNDLTGEDSYEYEPDGTTVKVTFKDGETENVTVDWCGASLVHNGISYLIKVKKTTSDGSIYLQAISGNALSSKVLVPLAEKTVAVQKIEMVSEPTFENYINDFFFKCATTNYNGNFEPIDFSGLKLKVTMTNGDTFYVEGNDLTEKGDDGLNTYSNCRPSNHHVLYLSFKNQTENSADLVAEVLGKTVDLNYTIERIESPYKSISIIPSIDNDQIRNMDATGLKIKISYKDGTSKVVTLGAPIKSVSSEKYSCNMGVGGYKIGDGFEPFGWDTETSGVRMNGYYLGNGEYASIIWNNSMLRICDQMISLDPDKWTTVKGDATVDIDTAKLSKAVIDSLNDEDEFAVAEKGALLYNTINVDEVDPSNKITVKAKGDDTDIKSCYDINFSYLVQGNEYQLTELPNGKIAVTVPLDESLWGKSKDEIVLYREHAYADGTKVEQITDFTISDDGKFITFESDKFSTFALGYKDKKDVPPGGNGGTNNEKPILPETVEKIANTLDNTPIAATMMLVCSSGLCLVAVARKRKELE